MLRTSKEEVENEKKKLFEKLQNKLYLGNMVNKIIITIPQIILKEKEFNS